MGSSYLREIWEQKETGITQVEAMQWLMLPQNKERLYIRILNSKSNNYGLSKACGSLNQKMHTLKNCIAETDINLLLIADPDHLLTAFEKKFLKAQVPKMVGIEVSIQY